jgi:antitoxin component YwqK of YwqJK toxin-antitoxin module
MNNKLIIIIVGVFLISFSVSAQDDINKMDAQGKRHGLWKKMYPGTKQLRYEGTFEHGKEVGTFKFYCEECKDKPMAVKEFNANDDISYVKYYTIKGKLVSEGKMKDKDRIGEWIYYHEKSNEIMTKEQYVNGKLDGIKTTYYPNGKITEEITYKNGVMEGENNYYSVDGKLLKKLNYKNEKLQGPATYYDANGNVTIEGFYKNDKKDGLWKYYKNGKVELEETYPKPIIKEN